MNDENTFEHQKDEWDREQMIAKEENEKARDSGESGEIENSPYPDKCEVCDEYFFINSIPLTAEESDKFGCGWKVIKLNGRFACPTCLINELWDKGKNVMEV